MRKSLAFAVVACFILAIPALAGEEMKTEKHEIAKGTISAWDEAGKTLKLKDDTGKEWSFTWKETINLHGVAKVGEVAMVKYMTDADGNMRVKKVFAGKEEIAKAEKSMEDKKMDKAGTNP